MSGNKTTVSAIFDGEVLRPETPLDLEPNARYLVTIQLAVANGIGGNAWDVLERFAGTVDASPDWSVAHDHYLYGVHKN